MFIIMSISFEVIIAENVINTLSEVTRRIVVSDIEKVRCTCGKFAQKLSIHISSQVYFIHPMS